MSESIKHFMERTTLLGKLARWRRYRRFSKSLSEWKRQGCVLPMPTLAKQEVVASYIRDYKPDTFIETGTYTGHMVYGMLDKCKQIYSIELDKTLYEKAVRKFAGYEHVHLIHGESSVVLADLMNKIKGSCVFWLDAHYSGGQTTMADIQTPIMRELLCILDHPLADRHVILIDDARCFTGQNDYPRLEDFREFVLERHPEWVFEVEDDIIRIHSPR